MTEIIVTKCEDCPYYTWHHTFCRHPKSYLVELEKHSIPDRCPLIKEDTVIKINVNE